MSKIKNDENRANGTAGSNSRSDVGGKTSVTGSQVWKRTGKWATWQESYNARLFVAEGIILISGNILFYKNYFTCLLNKNTEPVWIAFFLLVRWPAVLGMVLFILGILRFRIYESHASRGKDNGAEVASDKIIIKTRGDLDLFSHGLVMLMLAIGPLLVSFVVFVLIVICSLAAGPRITWV